jgi:hypothetical protein
VLSVGKLNSAIQHAARTLGVVIEHCEHLAEAARAH